MTVDKDQQERNVKRLVSAVSHGMRAMTAICTATPRDTSLSLEEQGSQAAGVLAAFTVLSRKMASDFKDHKGGVLLMGVVCDLLEMAIDGNLSPDDVEGIIRSSCQPNGVLEA